MPIRLFLIVIVCCCLVFAAQADTVGGIVAYERGDFAAAVKELTPPAEQGDATAQVLLGAIYGTGSEAVPRDDQKAVAWFRRAAEQGSAAGQNFLGEAYRDGLGVAVDQAQAATWFRRSAEQGFAIGQYHLAMAYDVGAGVTRDVKEAVAWLKKSAAQGYALAEAMLGRCYIGGLGTAVDEKLGVQWLRKAANQGLPEAQADLGVAYANGVGTRRDKVQAFKWLELALRGLESGKLRNKIVPLHRTLAQALTPAQRERANAQVAKFVPKSKAGRRIERAAPRRAGEAELAAPIATGSGFVVSPAGHIVTNDHVVAGCGHMRVRHLGPDSMPAEILARDSKNDLAVLKIAGAPGKTATFRTGADIRPGDGVVVVGFPLTGLLAEDANVTTGGVSALAGFRNDPRYLQISAPVQPGNSGGPLLDLSGNVVGVVSAELDAARMASTGGIVPQNVNFAIKLLVLRQFLDANHVPYRGAASNLHLEAADVGEAAKGFTALVECWK